jgi:hypothetical protein
MCRGGALEPHITRGNSTRRAGPRGRTRVPGFCRGGLQRYTPTVPSSSTGSLRAVSRSPTLCGPSSRIESNVPDLDVAWSRLSLDGKPVVSVDKDFRRWLHATQNTLQTGAHVRVEVLRRDVRRLGPLKPIVPLAGGNGVAIVAGDGAFERVGVTVGAKLWRCPQIDGYHYMDVVDRQFSESERDSMGSGELSRQLRVQFHTEERCRRG